MADEFKTYDKAPIMSINIKQWGFAVREIILAVTAIVLLIFLLIFIGLYAGAETKLADEAPSASAIIATSYCETKGCLDTASRALDLMNTSVDPCEDFFQYACGNYKTARPVAPNQGSRTVIKDMSDANRDKLIKLIEKPIDRMHDWGSERKLKWFFQSCNDMFKREKERGKPFLEQIVANIGGWDVIGTWDNATWDLNTMLKKVQSDFWTNALYSPNVVVDPYNSRQRTIELYPAGTGKWMYWSWYMSSGTEQIRQDYQKFIRRVGSLLQRDADVNMTAEEKENRLDLFVNDTYTIEYKIASIAQSSRYTEDPYLEESKETLGDLNTLTGNVINWVDQLSYLFNTAEVNRNTKVVLLRKEYFQNMTAMIASLPETDRNRMMHNYLIWRMAENYVQEMSWEYIHANREIYVDIHGYPNFMGTYKYCFHLAETHMGDALSALFIADHFSSFDKSTVDEIADNIKKTLQDQLDATPWMDTATKNYAKEKLDMVTFKLGYPQWMTNHNQVDQLYIDLDIKYDDMFGNVLELQKLHKNLWNDELQNGENREEWLYPVYHTNIAVYWYWNEVIAPSGILQLPVFNKAMPHAATFGALGSLLGRYLHHIVDDWGKYVDKNGDLLDPGQSWWTNHSLTSYQAVDDCVYDVYSNVTKTFKSLFGPRPYTYRINARGYTPRAIAITNGIRLALKGYNKWVTGKGINEKMIPGLHMTNEKMLFLAHAQTFCYNRDEYDSFIMAIRGSVEEDLQVNNALGQLQEFTDAFNCKVGSKMNHAKKCDYY